MIWPDQVHCSSHLQLHVVSLSPLLSTLSFFQTGAVRPHLNYSTHRSPQYPLRNLLFLKSRSLCPLSFSLQRTQPSIISLELTELRILYAVPGVIRLRTLLTSFCTVQLRSLCAAHSLWTPFLFTTCGPGLGKLPSFLRSMVFLHAPIPREGLGNNNIFTRLLT